MAKPPKPSRPSSIPAAKGARRAEPAAARRLWWLMGIFTLLTTGAVVVCTAFDIPIGQRGAMEYRASPFVLLRLVRALPAGFCLLILWPILDLIARRDRRRVGMAGFAVVMIGLCAWAWWLPPEPAVQQLLTYSSPAQDGAFITEAEHAPAPIAYLQSFDEGLDRSTHDVQGTRMLSNPPGMTLLAMWLRSTIPPDLRRPPWPERMFINEELGEHTGEVVLRLRYSLVLLAVWCASAFFAYLLGREFLPPLGAAAVALLITITPATVEFSPGKDTAQLLTINLMLWAWFAAVRRRSVLLAVISGIALAVGTVFGLIHIWIAFAAVMASVWHDWRQGRGLRRTSTAAGGVALGALLLIGAVYLAMGWNIPRTIYAVGIHFRRVQLDISVNRRLWAMVGVPMFVMFLTPALPALGALSLRRWRRRSWGMSILMATLGVMALTWLVGVTYELPRLWIAFLPLLTLGVCADQPLFHARTGRSAIRAIWLLLAVSLLATAFHASLLDVRESEYRLVRQRLWN